MSKKALTALFAVLLVGVAASPANALPGGKGLLGVVLKEIGLTKQYVEKFTSTYAKKLPGGAGKTVQNKLKGSVGALGLPDTQKAKKDIVKELNKSKNRNEVSSIVSNIEADTAKAYSNGILGEEGQENSLKNREEVEGSIESVQQLSSEAQKELITQNVMKKMAEQNQHIISALGQVHASSESAKIGTAYSNKMTADLVKQSAREAQKSRDKDRATAALELQLLRSLEGI